MINFETHEVHAWAVIEPKSLVIQCYLDPSVPNYHETCNKFKEDGFLIAKLFGEVEVPEECFSFTKEEIKAVLEPDLIPPMIAFIVKKLGFTERGIK
jgi:hypothetical protein